MRKAIAAALVFVFAVTSTLMGTVPLRGGFALPNNTKEARWDSPYQLAPASRFARDNSISANRLVEMLLAVKDIERLYVPIFKALGRIGSVKALPEPFFKMAADIITRHGNGDHTGNYMLNLLSHIVVPQALSPEAQRCFIPALAHKDTYANEAVINYILAPLSRTQFIDPEVLGAAVRRVSQHEILPKIDMYGRRVAMAKLAEALAAQARLGALLPKEGIDFLFGMLECEDDPILSDQAVIVLGVIAEAYKEKGKLGELQEIKEKVLQGGRAAAIAEVGHSVKFDPDIISELKRRALGLEEAIEKLRFAENGSALILKELPADTNEDARLMEALPGKEIGLSVISQEGYPKPLIVLRKGIEQPMGEAGVSVSKVADLNIHSHPPDTDLREYSPGGIEVVPSKPDVKDVWPKPYDEYIWARGRIWHAHRAQNTEAAEGKWVFLHADGTRIETSDNDAVLQETTLGRFLKKGGSFSVFVNFGKLGNYQAAYEPGLTIREAWARRAANLGALPTSNRLDNRRVSGSMLAPGSRFGVRGEVARRKARLINNLKDMVGQPHFRSSAATRLAEIACKYSNDPELGGLVMDALEGLLVSDDFLFRERDIAVANGIASIARSNSRLIRPSTFTAAEKFLPKATNKDNDDNYENSTSNAKARLLHALVENRSDLAQVSTINALGGLLTPAERSYHIYRVTAETAADGLLNIIRMRPDLAEQAINTLGGILFLKDASQASYEIAAEALAHVVDSPMIDGDFGAQALNILEHAAITARSYKAILVSVNSLRGIIRDKPRLIRQSTIAALRYVLEHEDVSSGLEASAQALGVAWVKRPDLFSQTDHMDILSDLGLHSIWLGEGGDARDTTSAFAEGLLSNLGRLRLKKSPKDFPILKPLEGWEMVAIMSLEEFLPEGCTFVKAAGRTLIYRKPDGKYLALKFLKSSERGEMELLQYESEFFDWMNENKEACGFQSTYPKGYLFGGRRIMQVRDIGDAEIRLSKGVDTEGNKVEVDRRHGIYTFMAYEADELYFRYLNGEDVSEEEFLEGSRRCIHDLFILARYGIMHTSLIELFHNVIQRGREDGGRYLWMVGIMREFIGRSGTGMIHAWDAEVRYPNLRVSGIADLAELGPLYNIIEPGYSFNPFPKNGVLAPKIKQRFGDNTGHIYLASYLGDYLLAYALVVGDYYKKKGELDWRKPEKLAEHMKEAFSQSLCVFVENRDSPKRDEILTVGQSPFSILEAIDFTRLARQMAFFMSGEYKDYIDKDMPEEIFGISGIRIMPGDGWGHIHGSVIEKALTAYPEFLDISIPLVIEKYFDNPPDTHRQIPERTFVFRPGFESLIKAETNAYIRRTLEGLYAKYSRGWRFDGIHEDLGPINGPLALQELVKALYVTTSLMVADASEQRTVPVLSSTIENPELLRSAL